MYTYAKVSALIKYWRCADKYSSIKNIALRKEMLKMMVKTRWF